MILKENVKLMLYQYLYSTDYASTPIDVDKLVGELKTLLPFKDDENIKPTKITIKVKRKKQNKIRIEGEIENIPVVQPQPVIAPPPGFTPIGKKKQNVIIGTQKVREKKCPNGTRRNKKTGMCEPLRNKSEKRCPNGTRRNTKTGMCDPIRDNKQPIANNANPQKLVENDSMFAKLGF
jgi:hypothetical protein